MAHQTGILDLPVELLILIFSDLDVADYLRVAATCKALHAPNILYEPSYWSNLVRTTFRLPNQPVLAHDGVRWHKLYKRMHTQSRVYLWGNNDKGSLAIEFTETRARERFWDAVPDRDERSIATRNLRTSWPEPMRDVKELGVISDLQCGGWSTNILTAKGAVYMAGVIDGTSSQRPADGPVQLLFPPGFTNPVERYHPNTAVKQLSVGRSHVLALSDSGRIWSWRDARRNALHVKFLHHDLTERAKTDRKGVVHKVVAGWNKSAALIHGTGIVLWEPLEEHHHNTELADIAFIMESGAIPHTSFRANGATLSRSNTANDSDSAAIGEVRNFIVLEHTVLFNTHLGKVFVSEFRWEDSHQRLSQPVELPLPHEEGDEAPFATDVQGSFQSCAIFTKSGSVLTGKEDDILDHIHGPLEDRPLFSRIPALQHKEVIQVAFGDYHFHALHAPGFITSYGKEPHHCGAFGLGTSRRAGVLRGLTNWNNGPDTNLVPHAYSEGRRIWFLKEKEAWLDLLDVRGLDTEESKGRHVMVYGAAGDREPNLLHWPGEVSEWIEQEGNDWESKFGLQHANEDGLGSHFALSVTAAGWHSGALVLVNEELEEKIKDACEVPDPSLLAAMDLQPRDDRSIDAPPTLLNSAINAATDYGRRFLGLPPNGPATPPNDAGVQGARSNGHFQPVADGRLGPRPGAQYVWHDAYFPRLVLSNGEEMPGTIAFDKWRYGRPEWDLSYSP